MMTTCVACRAALRPGLRVWHFECPRCGYEGSTLEPRILEQVPGGDLDESSRESGLESLRKDNFRKLHARMMQHVSRSDGRKLTLLDVGCAHGWYLEETSKDFVVLGIEPDQAVADATRRRGLPVKSGFFPDALDNDERFDVIVFNDVLEHIPGIGGTLAACHDHLLDGGLLVVNAPSRKGVIYRVSRLLARLGLPASFDRMWQVGFPSPHVHYLDTNSMVALGQQHGFVLEDRIRLPSIAVKGLFARIRYSKNVSFFKAFLLTCGVTAASPLLRVFPPDIEVWFLRRQ